MAQQQEGFVVSARKYRPESWKEVIGQEAITETLHNAIEQDHMAHAYLFCGPRGVGKTTCARIFAKEINRSDEHSEDEDFSFNVFELDAASNNSVEDIRSLTDQVRIPPQVGEYKVYIIDEVHMLSKQAFNAFLKTLEEPPKHAIFILATTEKHKIIPTILSRCQIYDFNRIGVNDIVGQLTRIAKEENIAYEEEALHVIAQKADGAMRDALSIFDQLSSFTNDNLTYEAVLKNLHVLDYDYYFRVIDHLQRAEFADVLVILDSILKQGFDGQHFINGLGNHLRDLLVCKEPKTLELLEVGDSVKSQYLEQSQSVPTEWLIEALKLVNETDFRYRNAPNPRILLETTLLSLASLENEKKKSDRKLEPLAPPAKKKALPENEPEARSVPETEAPALEESPLLEEPKEISSEESTPENAEPVKQEPTPEVQEDPATTESVKSVEQNPNKKRKRRPTMISLKMEEENSPSNQEIPEDSVPDPSDEENTSPQPNSDEAQGEKTPMAEAWKRLGDELVEEGKSALYSILAKQDIDDQFDGKEIKVKLYHGVDEEEFNQHKADILAKMRAYSGNRDIGLSTERIEGKEEGKLFTPQDKFEYLAKQNPLLRKLKTDLDLDISY